MYSECETGGGGAWAESTGDASVAVVVPESEVCPFEFTATRWLFMKASLR